MKMTLAFCEKIVSASALSTVSIPPWDTDHASGAGGLVTVAFSPGKSILPYTAGAHSMMAANRNPVVLQRLKLDRSGMRVPY
ncbi:hypothetical protein FHW68_003645 [Pseudomonas sp. Tn43]|uniref:hypothetical protein n=1 Tax=unclassified Pseudomonas TaxID=196821 RepID=UPI0017D3D5CD|nr:MULTISPECIES: hypothetical protein [unclassified Pseudomonas]MBB3242108.1 hypothetical protein [Pseudomonas sp. Tn43]